MCDFPLDFHVFNMLLLSVSFLLDLKLDFQNFKFLDLNIFDSDFIKSFQQNQIQEMETKM